jgi:sulfite reductase alpha subunit-like flavoprotein
LKVFTAFSRAQESKQYVQHIIKENSALLSDLILAQNARIYVSGRAKLMPQSVEKAFLQVLSSISNPADYLRQMKKDKRYQ